MQLRGPARRAGADPGPGGQLAQGEPVAGDHDVARVLARGYGGQRDAVRGSRGQVLEGVHGDVDVAAQQRVAQGADEDAGATRSSGVPAAGAVALGRHLDELGLAAERGRGHVGHQLGLGAGEQGARGCRSGWRSSAARSLR